MKISHIAATATLGLVALAAQPAAAHHSTAMFEWGKETKITGTIKEFQWTNPHSWIVFIAPNAQGGTDEWGFEGMSPNFLGRNGWSKHSLNPGDKVELTYYPLKDGRKGGFSVVVTFPDGHSIRELPAAPPKAP